MKSYYPAFTLTEITVAMVIAAIVTSASMYAMETLTRTSRDWETFQRENFSLNEAQQVMERDFHLARAVQVIDSQVVMQMDSGALVYTVSPCLVRQCGPVRDTLLPSVTGWQYTLLSTTALVDTLFLAFQYQNRDLPCVLIKHYPFADIARYAYGNTD